MKNEHKNNIIYLKNTNLYLDLVYIESLYLSNKNIQLSIIFYTVFSYFHNNSYLKINNDTQNFIDSFIDCFSFYFIKPDFKLNKNMVEKFLEILPVISNIFAVSKYKNTDFLIKELKDYKNSFDKLMVLANSRNQLQINRKDFFDYDYKLASLWYGNYFFTSLSYHTELIQKNITEHLMFWDERIDINYQEVSSGYMISTYIKKGLDRIYKNNFNQAIKKNLKITGIKNSPDKNKIAVISGLWKPEHVVCRIYYPLLETLNDDYDITFISLVKDNYELLIKENNQLFSEIKYFSFNDLKNIENSFLWNNKFSLVFYTDIGMEAVSRYLSNIRIAPIQVMGYGHPVSTFGSEIDYFIGGVQSEDIDKISENYSEKFILTEGLGINISVPPYQINPRKKSTERFVINCSWSSYKINYQLIETLKKIIKKSKKKILFRFFTQIRNKDNSFIVLKNDLAEALDNDNFELYGAIIIDRYLEILSEGDIAIDSFNFGGVSSLVDNLFLGKPVITLQGEQHYNKAGSSIIKYMNLEELISSNIDEYITKTLKLINDDFYRENIINKLKTIDLKSGLVNISAVSEFKKTIDYIIQNHRKLKKENTKDPVFIR